MLSSLSHPEDLLFDLEDLVADMFPEKSSKYHNSIHSLFKKNERRNMIQKKWSRKAYIIRKKAADRQGESVVYVKRREADMEERACASAGFVSAGAGQRNFGIGRRSTTQRNPKFLLSVCLSVCLCTFGEFGKYPSRSFSLFPNLCIIYYTYTLFLPLCPTNKSTCELIDRLWKEGKSQRIKLGCLTHFKAKMSLVALAKSVILMCV